jgi:hypothetical protein
MWLQNDLQLSREFEFVGYDIRRAEVSLSN